MSLWEACIACDGRHVVLISGAGTCFKSKFSRYNLKVAVTAGRKSLFIAKYADRVQSFRVAV